MMNYQFCFSQKRNAEFINCNGVALTEVLADLRHQFNINIICDSQFKDTLLYLQLNSVDLKTTLDSICFYLNTVYTIHENLVKIGNVKQIKFKIYPNFLRLDKIPSGLTENLEIVDNNFLLFGTEDEITELLSQFELQLKMHNCYLELVFIDILINDLCRFRDVLKKFNLTVAYDKKLHVNWDILSFLNLLEEEISYNVKINQKMKLVDGYDIKFSSGEILERELYTVSGADTTNRFTSKIERRNVGFECNISPLYNSNGGYWIIDCDLTNSDYIDSRERSSKYNFVTVLHPSTELVELASYTKDTVRDTEKSLFVYNKKSSEKEKRQVIILTRVIK